MTPISKAGCILLDKSHTNIALVYRKKQNDYSFPKGHLELNETLATCATRETEEETGYTCALLPTKLPVLSYQDAAGGTVELHFFLAEQTGKSAKIFSENLVHECVWIPMKKVKKQLTYNNLKDYFEKIEPLL